MINKIAGNCQPRNRRCFYAFWFSVVITLTGCDGGIFGTGDGEDNIGIATPEAPVDGGMDPTTEPAPVPTPDPDPSPEPTEPPSATPPVTTDNVEIDFVNNESETDRPDALLRIVMAITGLEDNIVVTLNDDTNEPLVSLPGLSFLDGTTAYRAIEAADDHDVKFFLAEAIREGNAIPLTSVSPLDVSAGSVTTVVIRGIGTSSDISVDLLPAITKAEPETAGSQIRLIHAAPAYASNGALDVYMVPLGGVIADAVLVTTELSYDEAPLTDYNDLQPGQYELIVTPTGVTTPAIRINEQITVASSQVTTLVLRDDSSMVPGDSLELLSIEDSLLVIE